VNDFGKGVGFETSTLKSQAFDIEKNVIQSALKKTFAPEFLNRIDDIVIFNALEKEDIDKIVEIELKVLTLRIKKLGYELSLTSEAKSFISEKGFDKKNGARPLKRSIQKYIEDLLADQIVNNKIQEGDIIEIHYNKDGDFLNVKTLSNKKINSKQIIINKL
jgi:ATP-dependent Clp protease ATP-binding subunit ClpC